MAAVAAAAAADADSLGVGGGALRVGTDAGAVSASQQLVTIPGLGSFQKRQLLMAALGAVGLLYLGAGLGWLARRSGLMGGGGGGGNGGYAAAAGGASGPSAEMPLRAGGGQARSRQQQRGSGVDAEQGDVFGAWPSLQAQGGAGGAYGGAAMSAVLDDDDPDL